MKIGIVTLPFHVNYGGVLQAYALSKVLEKEGHDVVFIKEHQSFVHILKRELRRVINLLQDAVGLNQSGIFSRNKRLKFDAFIESHFKQIIDSKSYDIFNLECIIVGSDQVWRKWSVDWNFYFYYLNFVKSSDIIKISYAASFGVDTWNYSDEETLKLKKLIKEFRAVSVREFDAVSLCEKNLSIIPEVVLDPTLLLNREDYQLIGATKDSVKVIVTFILDIDEYKEKAIEVTRKILKMESIHLGPEMQNKKNSDEALIGIEEWLSIYSKASFIVTDSFHGTAFAINFNIPFIVLSNSKRGQSRLVSLLDTFNLSNRLIYDPSSIQDIANDSINWDRVNARLEERRKESIDFLMRNI